MRIINNPNPKPEQICICEKCQCEFAFTEGDELAKGYSNGVLGPGHYGWVKRWVVCPNCGETIYTYDSTKESPKNTILNGFIPTDEL